MANLYKDAAKRRKIVPGGSQTALEAPEGEKETNNTTQEKNAVEGAQSPTNLLAGLKSEKPAAKSYAFYLSEENVTKLKTLAKQEGVSASKLLDHILSEVLV